MAIRTLIVDDEPIARRVLREAVDQIVEIEVVGEAENGASALTLIDSLHPDLVFLDLEMPVMGGFEVVQSLDPKGHVPVIIIVTAFDDHAIQAFEAGAVDYVLKPARQERVAQAVQRAARLIGKHPDAAERLLKIQEIAEPAASKRARKIIGKAGEEYVLLNADEVLAFQADGELVWIITAKRKYLATQTLRALEERLADSSFRRIHRGALVNLDHVRKMSALSSQRWLVTLDNNLEFVVSKRLASSVRALLSW